MQGIGVRMGGIMVGMMGIGFGMRGIRVGMMGVRVGMQGIKVGMRGIKWNRKSKMKVYKIQFCFSAKIKKKGKLKLSEDINICFLKLETKPWYQGFMLRFSCNDPKQRYYLNGIWTCGPSVLILFQWLHSQFSFNEKLHFTQGCCLPRDFELRY